MSRTTLGHKGRVETLTYISAGTLYTRLLRLHLFFDSTMNGTPSVNYVTLSKTYLSGS